MAALLYVVCGGLDRKRRGGIKSLFYSGGQHCAGLGKYGLGRGISVLKGEELSPSQTVGVQKGNRLETGPQAQSRWIHTASQAFGQLRAQCRLLSW